jgi:hypothetical protein
MHPLTPDLSQLTDEEVHSKRSELMNRLNFAYQSGNTELVGQIQLMLNDYMIEIEKRDKKILQDAQKSGRLGGTDPQDITR